MGDRSGVVVEILPPDADTYQRQGFVYTDAMIVAVTCTIKFSKVGKATNPSASSDLKLSWDLPIDAEDIMIDGEGVTVSRVSTGPVLAIVKERHQNPRTAAENDEPHVDGGELINPMDVLGNGQSDGRALLYSTISKGGDVQCASLLSIPLKDTVVNFSSKGRTAIVSFDPASIGKLPYTAKVMIRFRLPAVPWSFLHMLQFERGKSKPANKLVENLPDEVAGRLTTKVQVDFRRLLQPIETIKFHKLSFINKALGSLALDQGAAPTRNKSARRRTRYGEEVNMERASPALMAAPADSDDGAALQAPLRADSEGEWNFANVEVDRLSQLTLMVNTSSIKLRYLNTVDVSAHSSDHPETCLLLSQDEGTQAALAQLESGRLVVYRDSLLLSDSKVLRSSDKVVRIGPMTTLSLVYKHIANNDEERYHEERLVVFNKAAEPLDFTMVVSYASEVKLLSVRSSKDDDGGGSKGEWISYRPSVHVTNPDERTIYVPLTASPSGATRVTYRRYD